MSALKISQLKLSSSLGANRGDFHCGPMAFFALLRYQHSKLSHEEKKTLNHYKSFVQTYYPTFSKKTCFTLEEGVEGIKARLGHHLRGRQFIELERTSSSKSFAKNTQSLFKRALENRGPFILQIAAYQAEVKKKVNVWTRGLGHFVLVLDVSNFRGNRDPFFEIEYWDPWDGRKHRAIAFEELYRDFTGPSVKTSASKSRQNRTISPAGHRVQSPYLCLLAPHMDLYSSEVYFAQRYIYVLERAFA